MEFYITRGRLLPELDKLQSILAKKAPIPIVDNVLIRSGQGHGLELAVTNLETDLVCNTVVDQMITPGALCLPAKRLFEIVRLVPDGMVHIAEDENNWATIKAGRSKYSVPGADFNAFPTLPQVPPNVTALDFPAKMLKSLIKGVSYAMAPEEHTLYSIKGVLFESNINEVKMYATDGHRLSMAEAETEVMQIDDLSIMIPQQSLTDLGKLLSDMAENEIITVSPGAEGNNAHFVTRNRHLSGKLLSGQFAEVGTVINNVKGALTYVPFNREALLQCIRRAMVAQDEQAKAVVFDFSNNVMRASAKSAKAGDSQDEIPAPYAGSPCKVTLNSAFLIDTLESSTAESIDFGIKESTNSICIKAKKDGVLYTAVIGAMRTTE